MSRTRLVFLPPVIVFLIFLVVVGAITYGPKDGPDDDDFHDQAAESGDPALCRPIKNSKSRLYCETNAIFRWAKNLSIEDCRSHSEIKKDQCLYYYSTHNLRPELCDEINDDYFNKRCHFYHHPDELFSGRGSHAWYNLLFALVFGIVTLYILIGLYSVLAGYHPVFLTSTFIGFLVGSVLRVAVENHPFGFATYHVSILLNIACPPNADLCVRGSWIALPTPWGIFADLLLIPIFYTCVAMLAHLLFKITTKTLRA